MQASTRNIEIMTYKESPHPHQSDMLDFIPEDYIAYAKDEAGNKTYGVLSWSGSDFTVTYQHQLPAFGGYLAQESIYGSPTYCPNATKQHKKHLETYGNMPHLVYFDSEESAVQAGFRKCQRCME